ncbi:DHH family phosphoesterase [Nanoarchaeota archaeon]
MFKKLKIKNSDLIEQYRDFINSLAKNDKIYILHDIDADGITSAVLLSKIIERTSSANISGTLTPGRSGIITDEFIQKVKSENITTVITLDLTADVDLVQLNKLAKHAKILIIDHHKIYHHPRSKNVLMIKPKMIFDEVNSAKFANAMFVYFLTQDLIDISDLDWMATVGLVGDIGYDYLTDVIDEVYDKYNFERNEDYFKTTPGRIASMVYNTVTADGNVKLCYDVLMEANSAEEVLKSKLKDKSDYIQAEIDKYVDETEKRAEFFEDVELIFYNIDSEFNIKSAIATILGLKFNKSTVITYSIFEGEGIVGLSARRDDKKVKVNEILEKAIEDIPDAHAGGHAVSSGATIPIKHFNRFKKRLFELLKKYKYN